MQRCSMRVELESNERWELTVRTEVADRRVADIEVVAIERNCASCFSWAAEGRAARGRQSARELRACVRELIKPLTFPRQSAARCTFETHWTIKADW